VAKKNHRTKQFIQLCEIVIFYFLDSRGTDPAVIGIF